MNLQSLTSILTTYKWNNVSLEKTIEKIAHLKQCTISDQECSDILTDYKWNHLPLEDTIKRVIDLVPSVADEIIYTDPTPNGSLANKFKIGEEISSYNKIDALVQSNPFIDNHCFIMQNGFYYLSRLRSADLASSSWKAVDSNDPQFDSETIKHFNLSYPLLYRVFHADVADQVDIF
jgi:hypothetical protein